MGVYVKHSGAMTARLHDKRMNGLPSRWERMYKHSKKNNETEQSQATGPERSGMRKQRRWWNGTDELADSSNRYTAPDEAWVSRRATDKQPRLQNQSGVCVFDRARGHARLANSRTTGSVQEGEANCCTRLKVQQALAEPERSSMGREAKLPSWRSGEETTTVFVAPPTDSPWD